MGMETRKQGQSNDAVNDPIGRRTFEAKNQDKIHFFFHHYFSAFIATQPVTMIERAII